MSAGSHSFERKFPIICPSRTPTLRELPLADKSARRRSKSTEKSYGTAINHFERFLQHINQLQPRTYETLLAEDVADETLPGMFST